MSLREEQCNKVRRILDDVLANRPTERDSLIVAVRKAFKVLEEPHWIPCSETLPETTDIDRQTILNLPSAQPERKKGRWIDMDDHVMCSCCGATHYGSDKNFCPNCGAKMEVPKENSSDER